MKQIPVTETTRFYMLQLKGSRGPKIRHADLPTAMKEAGRLIDKYGGEVAILEPIGFLQGEKKASAVEPEKK